MPLRVKLAIGAFAGVTAAWLIPRPGVAPAPVSTPTPPGQLTAAEFSLAMIPSGVSFRSIDGVRVFLVRTGDSVEGFHGVATTPTDGPLLWCIPSGRFISSDLQAAYDPNGTARSGSASRDLDRIQVLSAAGRVTIFPHVILRGPRSGPLPPLDASPCPAGSRVG